MKNWTRFYFDGNQGWGWIDSREDWEKMIKLYTDASYDRENLYRAKTRRFTIFEDKKPLTFGLYAEYDGDKTLAEFFEENGMEF